MAAAGAPVVDTGDALALDDQAGDHRQRLDGEVLPITDGVEVGTGGAEPAAAVHVAVERREPLLPVAVDVVGERVARLLHRLEERPEQRGVRRPPLEDERAAAAAPLVGAGEAGLHALEVGQAVGVVPGVHALVGGPALEVQRVAALEDHPVDAAGAAEELAARVVDLATSHVRLRLRLVLPVVEPVADRVRQRGRHVDERVDLDVGAAGLEHQDGRAGVGAEPVGEGAARRAAADDHEVVGVPSRSSLSRPLSHLPSNQCCGAGATLCQTCLVSRYSSSPAAPSSRPTPDCL